MLRCLRIWQVLARLPQSYPRVEFNWTLPKNFRADNAASTRWRIGIGYTWMFYQGTPSNIGFGHWTFDGGEETNDTQRAIDGRHYTCEPPATARPLSEYCSCE